LIWAQISAEDFPSPGDRLAHPGGGERLRERRVLVSELAFGFELRRPNHHALGCSDVTEHPGEKVLNELK